MLDSTSSPSLWRAVLSICAAAARAESCRACCYWMEEVSADAVASMSVFAPAYWRYWGALASWSGLLASVLLR